MSPEVSTGSRAEGYPCPRCGRRLVLIDGSTTGGVPGAWCARCQRVWREADEVDLSDLDALPEAEAGES